MSKFQETVYNKKVKEWNKDSKILRATAQSLYIIVWGGSSKLMQHKLMVVKPFETTEDSGDVTNLLKEIRRLSLRIEMSTSVYNTLDKAKDIYYIYR